MLPLRVLLRRRIGDAELLTLGPGVIDLRDLVYFALACFVAYAFSGHTGIYGSQRIAVPKPGESRQHLSLGELRSAGSDSDRGLEWVMPEGGDIIEVATEAIDGMWFAEHFPDASYAVATNPGEPFDDHILSIYRVEEERVLLLGIAKNPREAASARHFAVKGLSRLAQRLPALRQFQPGRMRFAVINGGLPGDPVPLRSVSPG